MEVKCSMMNCGGTAGALHPFPTDIKLCMSWVQRCGRPEYFEDFSYMGACPFLKRRICSLHFTDTDFICSRDKSLGLKENAIPLNFTTILPKEEECKSEESTNDLFIKEEMDIDQAELIYFDSTSATSNDEEPYLLELKSESLKPQMKRRRKLSDKMRLKRNATRIAMIRRMETQEQAACRKLKDSIRAAERRRTETQEQRANRKLQDVIRANRRRRSESEEQVRLRREKNAIRAAMKRRAETPEQRAERKLKDVIRAAKRRQTESELERQIRRYNDAVRAAYRRCNETEEQKEKRRLVDVMRAAKRRQMESDEQRQARLKADRERASRRRLLKKLTECRLVGIDNTSNDSIECESHTVDCGSLVQIKKEMDDC